MSDIPMTIHEKSLSIGGKEYSLDAIRLVSIRRLRVASKEYGVFIRTQWRVWRVNQSPLSREQAGQLAQTIADAVSSYRRATYSDEEMRYRDPLVIAGNDATVSDNTLVLGDKAIPLDGVNGVKLSGAPNDDFMAAWGATIFVYIISFAGVFALSLVLGQLLRMDLAFYAVAVMFFGGGSLVFLIFFYLFSRSPGVSYITLQTPSERKVVYKSEDREQAKTLAELIRHRISARG